MIYDISLPLFAGMSVYPGNAETAIKQVKSGSGASVLSEISITSHAGTHIDAPNHVAGGGSAGIDGFLLDHFYGSCRVIDVTESKTGVSVDDLKKHAISSGERILLKTQNSIRGFDTFYDDYVFLEGAAAQYLAKCGVSLVGIDSLSIKQRGLLDNTAHTALLSQGVPILEGINLSKVEPGEYTLSAFPLAFVGIDGAPARAVLITT